MRIKNFIHKGLKQFYLEDNPKGLPSDAADKLRKMLAFLQDMQDPDELRSIPNWKAHTMSGNRKSSWSMHVTRNWRLTFHIETAKQEICDVNYEDYH